MNKTLAFAIIVLCTSLFVRSIYAGVPPITIINNQATHEIQIQTLSSIAYNVECIEGDLLYGEFEVTSDGDLYPGDQRKYDLWLGWGNGVDFYIFNEDNYNDWYEGEEAVPAFEKEDVTSLSWSVTVDRSGLWYIIYFNDSPTYIKTVEGSIQHSSSIDQLLVLAGVLIGGIAIFVLIIFTWHSKFKKQ